MSKKVIDAEVLSNVAIATDIMKMEIYAPEAAEAAQPGQFINIYPRSESLVLPRPISICNADASEGTLTIVYAVVGKGTAEMAGYERGADIRITTPLGNGFDLSVVETIQSDRITATLIGGGIGSAPMVFLASRLAAMGVRCTAVTGFRKEPFLSQELREKDCRVIVTTDIPTEDAFVGTVVDCMEINTIKSDLYFACGPKPMLAAVCGYVYGVDENSELQVSMEERMGCGYGACVGCVCDVRQESDQAPEGFEVVRKKVCKDGPVFKGNEVVW